MPIYKMPGKKDGKAQYRVRINYVDVLGKSRQIDRVTYGSAEAKTLEKKLLEEIKEKPLAKRMTVQALFDEYMISKKSEVRESSYQKARGILERHILPTLKDMSLSRLTRPVLQDWKNEISKLNISNCMKQNIFSALRAMLNFGVKLGYLPSNPLVTVGNFRTAYFEKPQDKIQYYTREEFVKYIAKAAESIIKPSDWNYYVFFAIAYFTGMRKGEINALKWSDIDNNIIHVRRSVTQKLKGTDVETPPKNKSSYRDIQMPLQLVQILNEHQERQKSIPQYSDDFRVCGGARCLRDTSIANRNIRFAEAAGLHIIRIHDFRHSHASLLANAGINIQEIARRLGHSDVQMTWNTYSHLYPKEEERAVAELEKIKLD